MTLAQIIKQKLDRLESVPDTLVNSLVKIEKEFFNKLLKLVSQLEVEDGFILQSKKNFQLLAEIQSSLKQLLLDTGYVNDVKDFISEFDSQAKINNAYFAKAFQDSQIPSVAGDILTIKKNTTANLLLGETLDSQFINAVKNQVELAVTSKASFSETIDALQTIVTGNAEVDSKLAQYTKQIAYDAFAISDRAYTKAFSDSINAQWFKYSGTVIKTSRPFCDERHNKFYFIKEIQEWAGEDWAGKIQGTNTETIFSTAGGYNCRHSILPVSIFSIPIEVIKRNVANGNYKPSDFEKQELNL